MSTNPINLIIRFLLEIGALITFGMWGWDKGEGWVKYLLAIALPIIAAILWGTFAVPDDPSRSGNAPVPVPGAVRFTIEMLIFGAAVLALYAQNKYAVSWVFGAVVIIHYAVSYDRIIWLFSR